MLAPDQMRSNVLKGSSFEEQDFASVVAIALRRYERQGVLETVGKDAKTQALSWRLLA